MANNSNFSRNRGESETEQSRFSPDGLTHYIRGSRNAKRILGVSDDKWELLKLLGLSPVTLGFSKTEVQWYDERELAQSFRQTSDFLAGLKALDKAGLLDPLIKRMRDEDAKEKAKAGEG